jgi:hypothetical protein
MSSLTIGSDVKSTTTASEADSTSTSQVITQQPLTPALSTEEVSDQTRKLELWSLVQPFKIAALAGYGREVVRLLMASSALAHDPDLLYALQVPYKKRVLSPQVTYKQSIVPLLHAAASAGHKERVLELLSAASNDAHLFEKRDSKGQTPIIAAAAAGEPGTLAALLSDKRATLELIATEGIQVDWAGGVPFTAFATTCNAASAEANATSKLLARLLFRGALDIRSIIKADFAERGHCPTIKGAAECARLLVATGAVDPSTKTGQGSAMEELAATPERAAVIRGARPTQLSWAMSTSAVREAVGETLLLDPRCTRNAISSHWMMLRTSAFWNAVEAFGVLDRNDHGEPQPRFLSHDVAWWQATLAGGADARAALNDEDRGRLDAHALIRLMTPFLRPDTIVLQRPTGPFFDSDGSDGPGIDFTAEEVCEDIHLNEIAPIVWAKAKVNAKVIADSVNKA